MKRSIYERLSEHIHDGVLDSSFTIEQEETEENAVRYAPGAEDGIFLYHMPRRRLSASEARQLALALRSAATDSFETAEPKLSAFLKEHRAVEVIYDLQSYIITHAHKLDPDRMHSTAIKLMVHSADKECVKAGMEILELFTGQDESVKQIVRNLSLCDEFTLNALWFMKGWENGNEEIFHTAKKVHGWGRIHAADLLIPDTEEKKRWLLHEGPHNEVVSSYSALTCWKKSDAEKLLNAEPSTEEYRDIGFLIEGMLDEGPSPGISVLENRDEILNRYVEISWNYDLQTEDYERLYNIGGYARDTEDEKLFAAVEQIMVSEDCYETVVNALKEGKGFRLASSLRIPYEEQLFNYMVHDFEHYWMFCWLIVHKPEYTEKTIELFEDRLPLEQMIGEPQKIQRYGEQYRCYDQLQIILDNIMPYPLSSLDLVLSGLRTPFIRSRYTALRTITQWVSAKQIPLFALSGELYEAVKAMQDRDVSEEESDLILSLVNGQISFEEESEEFDA